MLVATVEVDEVANGAGPGGRGGAAAGAVWDHGCASLRWPGASAVESWRPGSGWSGCSAPPPRPWPGWGAQPPSSGDVPCTIGRAMPRGAPGLLGDWPEADIVGGQAGGGVPAAGQERDTARPFRRGRLARIGTAAGRRDPRGGFGVSSATRLAVCAEFEVPVGRVLDKPRQQVSAKGWRLPAIRRDFGNLRVVCVMCAERDDLCDVLGAKGICAEIQEYDPVHLASRLFTGQNR